MARQVMDTQLEACMESSAVVAWSQQGQALPLMLRLEDLSNAASLRDTDARGRPSVSATAFGLALAPAGFDLHIGQCQSFEGSALELPEAIGRGVQSVFEFLAAADLRSLQILASSRGARLVDACDCVRLHSLTSGRFHGADRSAVLQASTSKAVGALLTHVPAPIDLPGVMIERLISRNACKVRPLAKGWLRAHWGNVLCQLLRSLTSSAASAGRTTASVKDVVEMARQEAWTYAGYSALARGQ